MRNSNKILLIAVVLLLAFVLSFILVMGLTARNLFEQHGRTVQMDGFAVELQDGGYCLAAASNTIALSFSSTALSGKPGRACSSTASASS
jgi:hypothetical protein